MEIPALESRPDEALVSRLLNRWAILDLHVPDTVRADDRLVLRRLVSACEWIDRIYWRQRSLTGWALNEDLRTRSDLSDGLRRLVALGYGPWDVLDDDKPFWGTDAVGLGGALYPQDLTRQALQQFIADHPDARASLMSPTTVVRRERSGLVGLDYAHFYRDDLERTAYALRDASRIATHAGFREFLVTRARDLTSGRLKESEARWIDVGESPIDIAIGPYEVYDDRIAGIKTAYEATVLVRDPLTDRLRRFESAASHLGRRLPGAVAAPDRRQRVVIGVYDVVFAAGRANMGAKPIAAMLPNDEEIRRSVGSRLLLFRNVISGKFVSVLKPIADRLLTPANASLVSEEPFVLHTLLHEMAHALALSDDGVTANERLMERYSTIEECRADVVGLQFIDILAEQGFVDSRILSAAIVTFVAGLVRSLRFGAENDYSRAAAMILNTLVHDGAVAVAAGDRVAVDVGRVRDSVAQLAKEVQRLSVEGDYAAAGELIAARGAMPDILGDRLALLADVPVDVEFRPDASFLHRG